MASTAIAVDKCGQKVVSVGWIINKREDLIWFIASVITSYAFLAANLILVKLGFSVMIITWIWALGVRWSACVRDDFSYIRRQ
jgi:hypothetical protein